MSLGFRILYQGDRLGGEYWLDSIVHCLPHRKLCSKGKLYLQFRVGLGFRVSGRYALAV